MAAEEAAAAASGLTELLDAFGSSDDESTDAGSCVSTAIAATIFPPEHGRVTQPQQPQPGVLGATPATYEAVDEGSMQCDEDAAAIERQILELQQKLEQRRHSASTGHPPTSTTIPVARAKPEARPVARAKPEARGAPPPLATPEPRLPERGAGVSDTGVSAAVPQRPALGGANARTPQKEESIAESKSGAGAFAGSKRSPAAAAKRQGRETAVDSTSGLRIKDRSVPAASLKKMIGDRQVIRPRDIAAKIKAGSGEITGEWVTIAIVAEKSGTKETKTNKKFSVWTLSDLNQAEVTLYLFDDAYRAHWKESPGVVVGILNASVMPDMDGKFSSGKPCLSIDVGTRLIKLGTAADYGICKAIRKDGARCSHAVNVSMGEYCEYHVMSVFKKSVSTRMDLNRGPLFQAPQKSKKLAGTKGRAKPKARKSQPTTVSEDMLKSLSKKSLYNRTMMAKKQASSSGSAKNPHALEASRVGLQKRDSNIEEGAPLFSPSANELLNCNSKMSSRPLLGRGFSGFTTVTLNTIDDARSRAANIVKAKGGIKKTEKNVTTVGRGEGDMLETRTVTSSLARKRASDTSEGGAQRSHDNNSDKGQRKRSRLEEAVGMKVDLASDKGKELLSKRSCHAGQVDELRQMDRERRWQEAAQKEKMAAKMENIFEQDVTAFKCAECGITPYFPKSCKASGHVIDTVKKVKKRWFTCDHCGYHFSTLGKRMPTHLCKKCAKRPAAYTKAPMLMQKSSNAGPGGGPSLLVRGREQKFVRSMVKS
eukprot:m.203342 g.203342  ORF g.203342 m.203342 type:complete len:766 (+) comp15370_c0_seq7:479-2776(+)